jgi:hypothetical protein
MMRPTDIVEAEILTKDPTQVSLIQHDHVINTVPAYGTDHAFDELVRPRRVRSCKFILYSQDLHLSLVCAIKIVAARVNQQGCAEKRRYELPAKSSTVSILTFLTPRNPQTSHSRQHF